MRADQSPPLLLARFFLLPKKRPSFFIVPGAGNNNRWTISNACIIFFFGSRHHPILLRDRIHRRSQFRGRPSRGWGRKLRDSGTVLYSQCGYVKLIQNGMVTDNGQTRPLTSAERDQLSRYRAEWKEWSSRKFGDGFPFTKTASSSSSAEDTTSSSRNRGAKPKFPCICSGCTQPSSTGFCFTLFLCLRH